MGVSKLIRRVQASDPEQAATLRIIDRFDQLTAAEVGLERLVTEAAEISGRTVWVEEYWNGRHVRATPGAGRGTVVDAIDRTTEELVDRAAARNLADAVHGAIVGSRLRGRRAAVLRTDAGPVLAASLEIASGRIGAVWLEGSTQKFATLDYVVAERLAIAVVSNALMTRALAESRSRVDRAAVERLLVEAMSPEDASIAAKEAQLPRGRRYVAIASADRPRFSASPESIGQIVARILTQHGIAARAAVIGTTPAIVAEADPELPPAVAAIAAGSHFPGIGLEFGVGDSVPIEGLRRSWLQAREALVLRSIAAPDRAVASFADLGVLHLFAQIPAEEVATFPDYVRVAALAGTRGSPSDLELLETYCDTCSLRATADALYLHFTTVRYRLARIEEAIGLRLMNPAERFRAHVAVKLVQIHRAKSIDAAVGVLDPPGLARELQAKGA